MGRPKGSKNKPKTMTEENITSESEVIVPSEGDVTSEIVAAEVVVDVVNTTDMATIESVEPVQPVEDNEQEKATGLDGFKSCMRCGRDESTVSPLTIRGTEKLCSNCL